MPHIHELIDFTVGVLVVHHNKVLLINHKKFGCWLTPGGHIELNENPVEAAHREVLEETGLEIEIRHKPLHSFPDGKATALAVPNYMDIHECPNSNGHQHINLTYVADVKSGEAKLNADEHNGIAWFSLDEVEKLNTFDAIKSYCREVLF